MTPVDLTLAALVGALYAAGFHLMLQRSLMRAVLGFVLLGHGTNLLLLASGGTRGHRRSPTAAPPRRTRRPTRCRRRWPSPPSSSPSA